MRSRATPVDSPLVSRPSPSNNAQPPSSVQALDAAAGRAKQKHEAAIFAVPSFKILSEIIIHNEIGRCRPEAESLKTEERTTLGPQRTERRGTALGEPLVVFGFRGFGKLKYMIAPDGGRACERVDVWTPGLVLSSDASDVAADGRDRDGEEMCLSRRPRGQRPHTPHQRALR